MYEITDKERMGLEAWYHERRTTLRCDEPEEGRRFQCFMHQVVRIRTGLTEHDFLDEARIAKLKRAGRIAVRARDERRHCGRHVILLSVPLR